LARLDRKRKKKTSNTHWRHPWDPDAKVTKMKDERTHLGHKAEDAVDLDTGAIVAVTLQGADEGDTTTIEATAAAERIEAAQAEVVLSGPYSQTHSLGSCSVFEIPCSREPMVALNSYSPCTR